MAEPTIAGIPTKDFDKWQAERVASGRAHVNDGGTMAGAEFATPVDVAAKADASALDAHVDAVTSVHGIADTSALLDVGDIGTTVQGHDADLDRLADAGFSTGPNGRVTIAGVDVGMTAWASMTLINGWTANSARYRREAGVTRVDVRGLNGSAATSDVFVTLPAGFRITDNSADTLISGGTTASPVVPVLIWINGELSANRTAATGSGVLRGTFAFPASSWPT